MNVTSKILTMVCVAALAAACVGTTPSGSASVATTAASAAPSAAPSAGESASPSASAAAGFDLNALTPGPNGEASTPAADIPDLTPECVQTVVDAKQTLAFLSSAQITWFAAVEGGVRDEAKRLGIEIVITADSNFDPAKQATDVETAMALKPDILVALANDPVSAAQAFKPAVDAGTTLVLYDNGIDGYTAGNQYVTIVTGDHYAMGKAAAELLAAAIGDKGKIGYMPFDAAFYNTNNREQAFKAAIEQLHPEIEFAAEQGFADPATVGEISSAMLTQNPDLDGIFVAWSGGPATDVLAALRAAGNTHTKVVSIDLDAANDVEMATPGSNYYGASAEHPFQMGQLLVRAAGMKLCGLEVPPFITVPVVSATRDTLLDAWREGLHEEPPQAVLDALAQ